MTAVPSPVRRRQAAPPALARALAAARAAEHASADAARAATAVPGVDSLRASLVHGEPVAADIRSVREKARSHEGIAELLVFTIGGECFGIDLVAVEEAIDLPTIHHVPEMPPAMRGVITVRGMLTSVYSPRQALGLSHAGGDCALIFRRRRSRIALIIDDVDDVRLIDLAHLRDAPGVAANGVGLGVKLGVGLGVVLGVVRQGDTLLSLVDADALLAACQTIPLLETV